MLACVGACQEYAGAIPEGREALGPFGRTPRRPVASVPRCRPPPDEARTEGPTPVLYETLLLIHSSAQRLPPPGRSPCAALVAPRRATGPGHANGRDVRHWGPRNFEPGNWGHGRRGRVAVARASGPARIAASRAPAGLARKAAILALSTPRKKQSHDPSRHSVASKAVPALVQPNGGVRRGRFKSPSWSAVASRPVASWPHAPACTGGAPKPNCSAAWEWSAAPSCLGRARGGQALLSASCCGSRAWAHAMYAALLAGMLHRHAGHHRA